MHREIHDLRGNQAVAFTAWARINVQPRGEGSTNHTHKTLHLPMSFLSVTDGKAGGCPGSWPGWRVTHESVRLSWGQLNTAPESTTQPLLPPEPLLETYPREIPSDVPES